MSSVFCFAVAGNSASEKKVVVALHKGPLFSLPSAWEIRRHR